MEEQTITDSVAQETPGVTTQDGVAIDDQGMAIAADESVDTQPEAAADEAGSNTNESDSSDSGEVDKSEVANEDTSQPDDKELTKWAKAKGLDLNSESEIKLAKMARESEKAMHSAKSEAKSVLKDEVGKTDPANTSLADEVAILKAQVAANEFYSANPEARDYDEQMGKALAEDPALLEYVRATGNIQAVYGIVKSQDLAKDTESAKKEGGQEALTQLANKQQATAVRGNAVNSKVSPSDKITAQNVDKLIAENGHEWYMKNREAINAAIEN